MAKTGTVVTRKCVSCGRITDKKQLIRVVRRKDGSVKADPGGTLEGRGAYICADRSCIEKAEKKKLFNRSFRAGISSGDSEELFKELLDIVR